MNESQKKLLKAFIKENLQKSLRENPEQILTEQGFWDNITGWIQNLGSGNQQLTQQLGQVTTQVQQLTQQNQELGQRLQAAERELQDLKRATERRRTAGNIASTALGMPALGLPGAAVRTALT